MRKSLIALATGVGIALTGIAATPASADVETCSVASIAVSGDNLLPLGQSQYVRVASVDVSGLPVTCDPDQVIVTLPSLSGVAVVNNPTIVAGGFSTTIGLDSSNLNNVNAGVAQDGNVAFIDETGTENVDIDVTPKRWVKGTGASTVPAVSVSDGEPYTARVRFTAVNWDTNRYAPLNGNTVRVQINRGSNDFSAPLDVNAARTVDATGLAKYVRSTPGTAEINVREYVRGKYNGNSVLSGETGVTVVRSVLVKADD